MSTPTTNYRDPDRGFTVWRREELVAPQNGGPWVPNPGDLVFDETQGFMVVKEVDYSTGYSTLAPWTPPDQTEPEDPAGKLIGIGPGSQSESYRMFLDTSVTPHILSPSSRLRFYGSRVTGYKVFLGTDISEQNGKVISAFYDPSGNFLGTTIPLESDPQVPTTRIPMAGYTTEALADGEVVSVVGYADDGSITDIARLLIQNTQVIRYPDVGKKYVQGISIDSPFISAADPQTLEFPINVAVESLPMSALVHYSDGSKHRLAIDGGKFSLYGLRNYIATVVGQEFPLVLAYTLGEDEVSYQLEPTANRRLTVDYRAKTTPADGAYEVKVYVFPVWINPQVGYRLEYWLYNLDRQTYYNVTPYMELGANSREFNPTEYGVRQTITMALDLNRVDGRFAPYRHVQTFQIALLSHGDNTDPNWTVYFTPDQQTGYGTGLKAELEYVNTNYWYLRLGNGFPSAQLWLKELYYNTQPLVNKAVELEPPEPTHMLVKFLNNTYEFPIEQWNEPLVVNNDLKNGELLTIHWLRKNYDTTLHLGMSALPVVVLPSV